MPLFADVTWGDPTINYIYNDEVLASTVEMQQVPKAIQHIIPPTTKQQAQQLFDKSNKELTALDTSAELPSYCVQSVESSTVTYKHNEASTDQYARLRANEGSTARHNNDLEKRVSDLEDELRAGRDSREAAFRWELLSRAIKGMYKLIWDNALEQQQRIQLVENQIYDAQNLFQASSHHHKYPNPITSLANRIYNSIPKCYFDSLQLMQQKRMQYRERRLGLAHPRVTKADFMKYLEGVHKDDVAFLTPICDLEVHDKWTGEDQPLFD